MLGAWLLATGYCLPAFATLRSGKLVAGFWLLTSNNNKINFNYPKD